MDGPTKMEKLFLHASRELNATLDYDKLMKLVLNLTVEASEAEGAMVYRVDPEIEFVQARFSRPGDDKVEYFEIPKNVGIIGWVAENQEPVIVNDVRSDPRFYSRFEEYVNMKFRSAMVVPLIGRGQMIGVVEAINKQNGGFTDADLDTLVGLAHQFAVAIDNANLYREARQEAMERQLLYEVGMKLTSTLNLDEVLRMILDSLRKVVGFDAGGIYVIDEEKHELTTVLSDGYGESYREFVELKFGQGLAGWVAKNGNAVVVPDVSKDSRYVMAHPETKSEIVAPMTIDGRIVGVINLESDQPAAYNNRSLELLRAFASHAAISLERAIMHKSAMESQRLQEQLTIARHIQLTFLPERDPEIAGYDISGVNIPSEEVGGDYFDFIRIIENQTGISIADISGKGIPAALLMASFRASLIAEIRNNYAIRTICAKVNRLMYESVEQGNYVTAFYGVLDSKNDIFTFSNCGHNRPIHLKRSGEVRFLKEGGPALGVIEDSNYEERPIFIESGDIILFYTDGVTEVYNSAGAQFGQEGLIGALKKFRVKSAKSILDSIYMEVTGYASPDHNYDDLTMIALKKL